jgi:hypothetical protein
VRIPMGWIDTSWWSAWPPAAGSSPSTG